MCVCLSIYVYKFIYPLSNYLMIEVSGHVWFPKMLALQDAVTRVPTVCCKKLLALFSISPRYKCISYTVCKNKHNQIVHIHPYNLIYNNVYGPWCYLRLRISVSYSWCFVLIVTCIHLWDHEKHYKINNSTEFNDMEYGPIHVYNVITRTA